ncbi:flagellin FliC [Ectothiorhodospiraceae bacterium BW-2]|nr:flagellin FliC [Ectothiorhodospiraceae bacterium BW-2]
MSLSIYTNVASMSAQRNVANSQTNMANVMQKLSSGLRVNSAKDDASGFAIARRMEAQNRGMQVAIRNASDGISMAQTAENALGQMGDMLQRMRELAVQSANGTLGTADRSNLNDEFQQLNREVKRVIDSTEYNGKNVVNGSGAGVGTSLVRIQVGPDNLSTNKIDINLGAADLIAGSINVNAGSTALTGVAVGGADGSSALNAIDRIDAAIDAITTKRAEFGAVQSRFESAINVLRGSSEQVTASRGRIMDTDFAYETAQLTKMQILQQAGVAMLSQANQAPQSIMSLLQ